MFDAPASGTAQGQGTVGYGINDGGTIVGAFFDSRTVGHGFTRSVKGKITVFDAPKTGTGKGEGTDAFAINLMGDVASYIDDSVDVLHGYTRTP
jgi:hypothetical protein